jgi:hypothetical protein
MDGGGRLGLGPEPLLQGCQTLIDLYNCPVVRACFFRNPAFKTVDNRMFSRRGRKSLC